MAALEREAPPFPLAFPPVRIAHNRTAQNRFDVDDGPLGRAVPLVPLDSSHQDSPGRLLQQCHDPITQPLQLVPVELVARRRVAVLDL